MLHVDREDAVAIIRIDHGRVNALDLELLEAVTAAIHDAEADTDVGAVVLSGNGRAFSAGVDLKRILDGGATYTATFLRALSEMFLAPLRSETPVVAAVDGHAIAGGAVLAAACDLVISADDPGIRIGLAELAVGVPFPTAAIEIMRRRLSTHLQQAVLTASLYEPSDALRMGFVDRLVPPDSLAQEAMGAARSLAAAPATTVALTKWHLRRPIEAVLTAHGADQDARTDQAWCSDEGRAAIAAFVDRTLQRPRD